MLLLRAVALNIAALAIMLLAAFGAGHLLTRRIRFATRLEQGVFTTALGLGVCALALLGLAVAGVLYEPVVASATIAGAILVLIRFGRRAGRLLAAAGTAGRGRYPIVAIVLATLLCQYWLLSMVTTQYPPILWDSTAYHLTLARTYLDTHQMTAPPGLIFPVVPALNHVLFAWALSMGGDVLPSMIEHALMTLATLGLVAWGVRAGSISLGLCAAALWIGHPLVAMLGASAYVDVGAACFAFLGLYALRVCLDGDAAWWPVSAALLAMSAGVKSPGVLLLAVAVLVVLVPLARKRLSPRTFVTGLMVAAAVAGPWYLVVWFHAGNPLWPASAALTDGVWETSARAFWPVWGRVGLPKTLDNFLWMPFHLVSQPALFLPDNNRLLLPIVAALPATWFIAIFNRTVRWWTGWTVVFFVIWFSSSQQMRFLVIAMPMAALAIASSVGWLFARVPTLRGVAWVGLTMVAVGVGTPPLLRDVATKGLPPADKATRDAFLRNTVVGYRAAEYINARVSADSTVGVINASWIAYHLKPRAVDIAASLLQQLGRPALQWPADAAFVSQMESAGVTWLLIGTNGTQAIVDVPDQLVPGPFVWPAYEVVYVDPDAAVIRRKPPASPNELITNGNFDLGLNGWNVFATPDMSFIVAQVTDGVLEFYRQPPAPGTSNQATVFQLTGRAVPADKALVAQFDLANTSPVRKRISVLILEHDFSARAVCTFWLPARAPVRTYAMRTPLTKPWTNAAIYFYADATGSNGEVYRVDNVSLKIQTQPFVNQLACSEPLVTPPLLGAGGG